jgi:hypothetical protein
LLYAIARFLGDLNAIAKGKFLQRLARKELLKRTGSSINRWIK